MPSSEVVSLALPFRGTWLARNSPARRVLSHGTRLFATTYAVDFVAPRRAGSAAGRPPSPATPSSSSSPTAAASCCSPTRGTGRRALRPGSGVPTGGAAAGRRRAQWTMGVVRAGPETGPRA